MKTASTWARQSRNPDKVIVSVCIGLASLNQENHSPENLHRQDILTHLDTFFMYRPAVCLPFSAWTPPVTGTRRAVIGAAGDPANYAFIRFNSRTRWSGSSRSG